MLRRVAARSSPPAAPPGRICQVWLQGGARAAGGLLARHPEGELTVLAHISGQAVHGPERVAELAQLDGWNARDTYESSHHHGPAANVRGSPYRSGHGRRKHPR
jgi:hypothetical protein